MKYKIENAKEFKYELRKMNEIINEILELDLSEKEFKDDDISNVINIQETLNKYLRLSWIRIPKIKIVSSDGAELTIR